MSGTATTSQVRTNQPNALHTLVRELSGAVLALDPTEIVDPRGLILDVTPQGDWVARVRTGSRQWAFGPAQRTWRPGRPTAWTWLNPADDEALPGRGLLSDLGALSSATGLDDPRPDVVRYRRGRRAMVRVVGYEAGRRRVRYLKLLRKKTIKRALRTYGLFSRIGADVLVLPTRTDLDRGVLVFDEVDGRSLHEVLWTADSASLPKLAAEIETLCSGLEQIEIPDDGEVLSGRGLDAEKKSALDMIKAGSRVRPELSRLQEAVEALELDELDEGNTKAGFIHADLHDKQVFKTATGLKVIDCEGSARGSAVVDRSNLVEHVRLRGYQGARVGHEAAALLRRVLGLGRRDRAVRALTALTRARLAGVYALRPWWWWLSKDLEVDALRLLNPDEVPR